MGQYNQAVITSAGQGLLAGVIASGKSLAFTNAKTSTRIYSSGLEALTSIADVMQTDAVSSATVMSNSQVKISTRFTNEDITAAYDINTIGIFAKADGDASDTLFAVITAVTPDSMPKYTSSNPVAYIYDVTIGMSNAQNITLVVSPTGTPSYGDLAAAQTAAENASAANLAPAYDSTATYAKDDFCVNGGKLYQCNADISTAEAFNPAHWTEVKVTEVMGGGGGVTPEIMAQIENAQWKSESSEQLFSETVTTVAGEFFNGATLSYAEPITADTLKVIFNGVEYTCPNTATPEDIAQGGNGFYGAPNNPETGAMDWSEYPFAIYSYNSGGSVTNDIQTENAGTYSVSAVGSTTECTQTFIDSVRKYTSVNIKYIKDYKGVDGYTGGVAEGGYYDPESDETIEDAKITNKAEGIASHAEGYNTSASGSCSHTEGLSSKATGRASHAEGEGTTASGFYSHAEGEGTTASGDSSHAEGINTTASGNYSHTEGNYTTASKNASHAEGNSTTASGDSSHAEGSGTTASGSGSHAEGRGTTASKQYQHVFGTYNVVDPSTTDTGTFVEIVGNGSGSTTNKRKNARTLDWSGNESLAGSLTLGMGTADAVTVTPAQLKALIALLNT